MSRGYLVRPSQFSGRDTIAGVVELPDGTRIDHPPSRYLEPDIDSSFGSLRRLSPRRNRWPEVVEFDRRVDELEQRQATILDELQALREQHRECVDTDQQALATWLADEAGERPEPTAPAVEARTGELQANLSALAIAVSRVFDAKQTFVEKHRTRLAKDAAKAKTAAIARAQQLVDELERAREEVVELRRAELWAGLFPAQQAVHSFDSHYVKCGRTHKAFPELSSRANVNGLFELVREDVAFLEQAADPEQRAILEDRDPRHDPNTFWAESPEGQQTRERHSREARKQIENAQWQACAGRKTDAVRLCADCRKVVRHLARGRCGRCSWRASGGTLRRPRRRLLQLLKP